MRRDDLTRISQAARLVVTIEGGEAVTLAVRLVFGEGGALLRVVLPPAPAGVRDPRELAARRLVQALDVQLARPGAPGMVALRRETELVLSLAEQLEALEERHGPAAARTLRLGAA